MSSSGPLHLTSRLPLENGGAIPVLGLGVFQTEAGAVTRNAVRAALEVGYRHIDTAAMYGNEADVGAAVRASGIPRDEIWVTTKLWHTDHGFEAAQRAAHQSQERLGLGPIDLYLIHWPRAKSPEDRIGTWKAFEKLQKEGVCRAIGVSNYTIRHLEELRAKSDVTPAVNQVEFHPFVYDPELLAYCQDRGIVVEAWSPLTRGRHLDDPAVRSIAESHHRTPAQILLRWGLQHGLVELPKSVHRARIVENSGVFDFSLAPEEVGRLDALRGGGRVGAWNPAEIP